MIIIIYIYKYIFGCWVVLGPAGCCWRGVGCVRCNPRSVPCGAGRVRCMPRPMPWVLLAGCCWVQLLGGAGCCGWCWVLLAGGKTAGWVLGAAGTTAI